MGNLSAQRGCLVVSIVCEVRQRLRLDCARQTTWWQSGTYTHTYTHVHTHTHNEFLFFWLALLLFFCWHLESFFNLLGSKPKNVCLFYEKFYRSFLFLSHWKCSLKRVCVGKCQTMEQEQRWKDWGSDRRGRKGRGVVKVVVQERDNTCNHIQKHFIAAPPPLFQKALVSVRDKFLRVFLWF